MACDPRLPTNHPPIVSAGLRSQLAGLKAEIDARPDRDEVAALLLTDTAGPASEVDDLTLGISNPPTQQEVQTLVEKINELLEALKRV